MNKRKALGKGLSALIPDANGEDITDQNFFQCPIESIEPNPYQPRKEFNKEDLEELVLSVKEKGIITPILVSKIDTGYQLIAGERRWRAAQKAGLERVPVVVRETTPIESLELALIENIHRKDLNPLEEALAYQKWLEDSNTTQEILAQHVGKDRSTITNMLRLLRLPKKIQDDIVQEKLTMGHARVLAGLKSEAEQIRIRDFIIKRELSVRQTEALIKKKQGPVPIEKKPTEEEYYLQSLAEKIKRNLGTKVEIKKQGKKGSINISFGSDEELERLLDILT